MFGTKAHRSDACTIGDAHYGVNEFRDERRFNPRAANALNAGSACRYGQIVVLPGGRIRRTLRIGDTNRGVDALPPVIATKSGASSARSRAHHDPRWHRMRSEEHTSELQSRGHLVCRLLLEK